MKQFVIKALVVLAVLFSVDFLVGSMLDKIAIKASGNLSVACNNKYDLVMMGASEMSNQYVTEILTDSLGITAYNFGRGGQNIYYQYALLNLMINQKNKPKFVLLEVQSIDFYDTPRWNTEKLNELYPFYVYDDSLRNIINLKGWKDECLLNMLKCYKHNTKLLNYINGLKKSITGNDFGGYVPIEPVPFNDELEIIDDSGKFKFDILKLQYFNRFISLCKENNIELIIINAPYYEIHENIGWMIKLNEIVLKEGITFLNYDNDPYFTSRPELYYNRVHFNKFGAIEYTNKIVPDIKSLICKLIKYPQKISFYGFKK